MHVNGCAKVSGFVDNRSVGSGSIGVGKYATASDVVAAAELFAAAAADSGAAAAAAA